MTRVTSVNGTFPARVLEARLHAEGIDASLRGAVDSPYLLTVGDLARVDVYVPDDQVDDACLVLLASEVDATLAAPREWAGLPLGRSVWARAVALAALVAAAVAPIVWLVRAG